MSARAQTWLWLAQRASAAVLGVAVTVHLVSICYAVRGGLSAGEIVARVSGHPGWLAFYTTFVIAAAVHAPLGVRVALNETGWLRPRQADAACGALAAALALLGMRAVLALYGHASA